MMASWILFAVAMQNATGALPHHQTAPIARQAEAGQRRGMGEARRARREGRRGPDGNDGAQRQLPPGAQRLSYGQSAAQRILLWRAGARAGSARPPLAVYVHGGGWQNGAPEMVAEKPAFFAAEGWAFASIGYRLLPEAPVETQAADVGAALRHLRGQAAAHGFDPDRILLFGHSAGAHLAALVATDPQFAGDAFAAIRGVIPVDGAAYDVAAQLSAGRGFMTERTYLPAFGTDPARHRALSPTMQAGGADAPDWLLLYVTARDDARDQSQGLAEALRRGGARAEVLAVDAGRGALRAHRAVNVDFGTSAYSANGAIRSMLRRIEGAR